jgi:hypothetical protein
MTRVTVAHQWEPWSHCMNSLLCNSDLQLMVMWYIFAHKWSLMTMQEEGEFKMYSFLFCESINRGVVRGSEHGGDIFHRNTGNHKVVRVSQRRILQCTRAWCVREQLQRTSYLKNMWKCGLDLTGSGLRSVPGICVVILIFSEGIYW